MTASENCEITVSFGDDDGKSVSVVVNQQISESSNLVSIADGPGGGKGGDGPGGGKRGGGPPGFGRESSECYDCDGQKLDCETLEQAKNEEVAIIIDARNYCCVIIYLGRKNGLPLACRASLS